MIKGSKIHYEREQAGKQGKGKKKDGMEKKVSD